MRYDLLIRGGEVIDPANDRYGRYDIAVSKGVIAAIESGVDIREAKDLVRVIKCRIDRDATRGTGLEPLRRARELADRVDLRLMVHIASAPPHLNEIAALLRPGDILTHCYTNQDNSLLDGSGQLNPVI